MDDHNCRVPYVAVKAKFSPHNIGEPVYEFPTKLENVLASASLRKEFCRLNNLFARIYVGRNFKKYPGQSIYHPI